MQAMTANLPRTLLIRSVVQVGVLSLLLAVAACSKADKAADDVDAMRKIMEQQKIDAEKAKSDNNATVMRRVEASRAEKAAEDAKAAKAASAAGSQPK